MFGLLNVRKPPGPTSHDVVARVRRLLPGAGRRRAKVGHAGTLDPFAEGVLVVCVGPATRLADYVQHRGKRYRAEIILGATSTTDDLAGSITRSAGVQPPTADELQVAAAGFVGWIDQVPPAHSAVHVNGRRAYELARAGTPAKLQPRQVRIDRLAVLDYDWPRVTIEVRCGAGTYIRALARDLGAGLGVGGYCAGLVRSAVGPFELDRAVAIDEIDLERDMLSPLVALDEMQRLVADAGQAARLANGNAIELSEAMADGEVAVLDRHGSLLAIAAVDGQERNILRPLKVFHPG